MFKLKCIYSERELDSEVGDILCPTVLLVEWKIFVFWNILEFLMRGNNCHFKVFQCAYYIFFRHTEYVYVQGNVSDACLTALLTHWEVGTGGCEQGEKLTGELCSTGLQYLNIILTSNRATELNYACCTVCLQRKRRRAALQSCVIMREHVRIRSSIAFCSCLA